MTKYEFREMVNNAESKGDRLYIQTDNPRDLAEDTHKYIVASNLKHYDDGRSAVYSDTFKTFVFSKA
jgi:hypothetical protein